jgi:hypothetical protein
VFEATAEFRLDVVGAELATIGQYAKVLGIATFQRKNSRSKSLI